MANTEALKRANKKYQQKFDKIVTYVKKGKRKEISDYARSRGESVNHMINRLIDKEMKKRKQ